MTQFWIVLAILTIAMPSIMIPLFLILAAGVLPWLAIWLVWGAAEWTYDTARNLRRR